jgi:hypothetical protein
MDEEGIARQGGVRIPGRVASRCVGEGDVTAVRIGLHELSRLRWPKQPLTGDGPRVDTAVPVPRLPWSTAAIQVPLGASAARGIARVTLLRRIFGYGVVPVIILLFVAADVLLVGGRLGNLDPSSQLFRVLGGIGFLLILTGLIPDAVARATGTPYVKRGQLRIPAARADAVAQLVKLNPKASIEPE